MEGRGGRRGEGKGGKIRDNGRKGEEERRGEGWGCRPVEETLGLCRRVAGDVLLRRLRGERTRRSDENASDEEAEKKQRDGGREGEEQIGEGEKRELYLILLCRLS
eukprot:173153-Hanusia_phi.AAC.1